MTKKYYLLSLILWLWMGLFSARAAEPVRFSFPSLAGSTVSAADYKGRWLVLNLWATWCPPCLREMPELAYFHEQHIDEQIAVLGLTLDQGEQDRDQLKQFITQQFPLGIPYPLLLVDGAEIPQLSVLGLPTTYFIAPDGRIAGQHLGEMTAALLRLRLKELGALSTSP